MASEYEKGERELDVFLRFLEVSQLPIDPASVEKRIPPEPDILCRHRTEGKIAFELVELCDRNLAKFLAQSSKGYLRTADPSQAVISKKLRCNYKTDVPIELLYHVGRIITPDNVILPTITPYLESQRHIFRRAWLLGRKGVHLVWSVG